MIPLTVAQHVPLSVGILLARILDQIQVSYMGRRVLYHLYHLGSPLESKEGTENNEQL